MRTKTLPLFDTSLLLLMALAVWSCGGGGTQGSPVGPANASVSVNPSVIDSGDRTEVRIFVNDISVDSIAIKVRFPDALTYVVESAVYELGGEFLDAGPEENRSGTGVNYLVFYFEPEAFEEFVGDVLLILELEGVSNVVNGEVEVDIDLDNPDIDNEAEFDIATPRFDAQDKDDIRVGDGTASSSSSSSSGG